MMLNENVTPASIKGENKLDKIKNKLKTKPVKKPTTVEEVKEFLKDKKIPIPKHDKAIIYIFDSTATEDIVDYNNFLVNKSDNKKLRVGLIGKREQVEEIKWDKGVIVGLGKGYQQDDGTYQDLQFELYDMIALGHFAGTDLSYDGVDYRICRTFDIICKLPE